jgi:glycosyltransferase involved in cell wall biosynthesis
MSRNGLLKDIPNPSSNKTGWPWTEESEPLTKIMPDGKPWPKINIVTPSYNQGQFLEETIRSVLLQNYPNLEYIIIDGGSTDNSIEIIKKYDTWINYWVSEKDNGMAEALNKAFARSTGDLIGWQNSDDYYGPGSFWACAQVAIESPSYDIYHGRTYFIDMNRQITGEISSGEFDLVERAGSFPLVGLPNQSMFIRRTIFVNQPFVDESYKCGMDTEMVARLLLSGCTTKYVSGINSFYRIHSAAKTFLECGTSAAEACRLCAESLSKDGLSSDLRKQIIKGFRKMLVALFRIGDASGFRSYVLKYWRFKESEKFDIDMAGRYCASLMGNKALRMIINLVDSKRQKPVA